MFTGKRARGNVHVEMYRRGSFGQGSISDDDTSVKKEGAGAFLSSAEQQHYLQECAEIADFPALKNGKVQLCPSTTSCKALVQPLGRSSPTLAQRTRCISGTGQITFYLYSTYSRCIMHNFTQ